MHLRRLAGILALTVVLPLIPSQAHAGDIDKYLPEDTELVLHANIRQALDSPLAKKYLLPQITESLKGQREAQEILTALGLDPLSDVHSLTMAAPGKVSDKKWTVVLQGNFDLAKIQAAVEAFSKTQADAVNVLKEGGITIYELHDPKHSQSAFAAFVDKENLIVSTTKDNVTKPFKKATKNEPTLNKHLAEMLKEGNGKETLWLAMVPDELKKSLPQDKQTMDIAKKVLSFKAGITLTDGVQVSLRVQATDDKGARDVRVALEGVKSLLLLAVISNDHLKDFGPTLTDILNSIKFTLDKSIVGMDLDVSGKQIEEGLKK
jgi:hypothetical protein